MKECKKFFEKVSAFNQSVKRFQKCVPTPDYKKLKLYYGEFDPGSGRTLAACLTHASLREKGSNILIKVAHG